MCCFLVFKMLQLRQPGWCVQVLGRTVPSASSICGWNNPVPPGSLKSKESLIWALAVKQSDPRWDSSHVMWRCVFSTPVLGSTCTSMRPCLFWEITRALGKLFPSQQASTLRCRESHDWPDLPSLKGLRWAGLQWSQNGEAAEKILYSSPSQGQHMSWKDLVSILWLN